MSEGTPARQSSTVVLSKASDVDSLWSRLQQRKDPLRGDRHGGSDLRGKLLGELVGSLRFDGHDIHPVRHFSAHRAGGF